MGSYDQAIVLNTDPFVLVSIDGSMRWSCTVKMKDFKVVGKANWWDMRKVKHRMKG